MLSDNDGECLIYLQSDYDYFLVDNIAAWRRENDGKKSFNYLENAEKLWEGKRKLNDVVMYKKV